MQSPGLYVQTENETVMDILMIDHQMNQQVLAAVSPIEDLVSAVEMDYSEYRKHYKKLYDEHPLFDEKFDISYLEYIDLVEQAKKCVGRLRNIDPVGHFIASCKIEAVLRIPDNGSASYLLSCGAQILQILEEPLLTQIRLRNIFEVTFAKTERATQVERYRQLQECYPEITGYFFRSRYLPAEDGTKPFGKKVEYVLSDLLIFRLLELNIYFRQEQKRIARCEHCWHYFIPKTKKETRYCDREWDGKSCKHLGPLARRRINEAQDNALEVYEILHHRNELRCDHYVNKISTVRESGFQLDVIAYGDWGEMAQDQRRAYLDGKISAADFIAKIDIYHEYPDFAHKKETPPTGDSTFREKVKRDMNFDPNRHYENRMFLELLIGEDGVQEGGAEWVVQTAQEQRGAECLGDTSLVEQIDKLPKKKPE